MLLGSHGRGGRWKPFTPVNRTQSRATKEQSSSVELGADDQRQFKVTASCGVDSNGNGNGRHSQRKCSSSWNCPFSSIRRAFTFISSLSPLCSNPSLPPGRLRSGCKRLHDRFQSACDLDHWHHHNARTIHKGYIATETE